MTSMVERHIHVNSQDMPVSGAAAGEVLSSEVALSFWGGVDSQTGTVIDRHHPLCGADLGGRALVIPHGRGSCTGSAVLLEIIHAGTAPCMILLNRPDEIIALGAIVADEMLQRAVPVIVLDDAVFALACQAQYAQLNAEGVLTLRGETLSEMSPSEVHPEQKPRTKLALNAEDQQQLTGEQGQARQVAMRIIQRMAWLQNASELIRVSRVHIDSCIYTGPAGLAFAEQLAAWRGKVAVPTTLNAISVDRKKWRELGVSERLAGPAERLAEAYGCLGAQPTYTCAPYLLADEPVIGEHIAWAESNAVVYANSVLGARTNKTPDLLDTCIALTGRAPNVGYYLEGGRQAEMVFDVPAPARYDDAVYPLLGYVIGDRAGPYIPAITGIEKPPSRDELKAFGAAFATTSAAGMFHIIGHTPEAATLDQALGGRVPRQRVSITREDLDRGWRELNASKTQEIDLVALGNPHFSYEEFALLAARCQGRHCCDTVRIIVTTNRVTAERAAHAGYLDTFVNFGGEVITDTCWCMLQEPVIDPSAQVIATNSAKYAHYAPGLTGRHVRFASLDDCVEAATSGFLPEKGITPWEVDKL